VAPALPALPVRLVLPVRLGHRVRLALRVHRALPVHRVRLALRVHQVPPVQRERPDHSFHIDARRPAMEAGHFLFGYFLRDKWETRRR
jgi:hypothetical protein